MADVGEGGGRVQGEFVWTSMIFGDFASVRTDAKGHRKEQEEECTYNIQ